MEFQCAMCDTRCANRQNMLRHVRTKHDGLWTCGRCESTFHSDEVFAVHQRSCGALSTDGQSTSSTVTADHSPDVQSTSSSTMRADQDAMTETSHSCAMCDREYKERYNLLRHVRTNHNDLWTCSRCELTFKRDDNFTYHRWTGEFRATGIKRPSQSQVRYI